MCRTSAHQLSQFSVEAASSDTSAATENIQRDISLMEDFELAPEWQIIKNHGQGQETNAVQLETHFFFPVFRDDSVVAIIDRSVSHLDALRGSYKLVFFIAEDCILVSNRHNFKSKVEAMHHKLDSLPGAAASFKFSGRIPRYDEGGNFTGKWRVDKARDLYTWSGVQAALMCGALRGRKDMYLPAEGYDSLKIAKLIFEGCSLLSRLVNEISPDDFVNAVRLGLDPFVVKHVDGRQVDEEDIEPDEPLEPSGACVTISAQREQPLKRGSAVRHKMQLRALRDQIDTFVNVSQTISTFMSAPRTGVRLMLYKKRRELDAASVNARLRLLRSANVPDPEKVASAMGPEPCIIDTDFIIKLLTDCFVERAGLEESGGVCVVLELMTALVLGPVKEEETNIGANGIREYSQQRKNLFRHLFDCLNTVESNGRYNCGLGRLISMLANSLGCPSYVLEMLRTYCLDFASRSVVKDLKTKASISGHMQAVCTMLVDAVITFKDNFIRTLKLGKTVGGNIGSYMVSHYCHSCVKVVQVAVEKLASWQDFMRMRPNETCWRCEGKEKPPASDPSAALCHACAVTPPTPLGEDQVATIKQDLRIMFPVMNNNMISPLLFSPLREGALNVILADIAGVTDSCYSLHASREANAHAYEQFRAWRQDRATYSMQQAEDPERSGGALTLGLSHSDTNNPLGLIRDMKKTVTHPLIGPSLKVKRFILVSDIQIYTAIEHMLFSSNVDRKLLFRVFPRGMLNHLDVGLHVVSKCSEHIFATHASTLEIYWKYLIEHNGGKGLFFQKPKLSTRLALLSAVYQAYARKSDSPNSPSNKDIL
jgi:hypothetical protein